ncbi:heterokaryon incompatibility protein-domain-containing protein [Tricladium varicosporioides]|nr:heterokaryon incompatibility protein-domain-containing protein [Hymenoscyphus varicosporioides]
MDVPYAYDLLSSSDSIRILVLEPSSNKSDELKGDLKSLPLSNLGNFEALSYCWGLPDPPTIKNPSKIILPRVSNTKTPWSSVTITPNCSAALRRLRLPDKPRTLWIDAICINQQDSTEKEKQIPLMGDIYRQAKQVIVWLGEPESEAAERAFEMITPLTLIYDQEKIKKSIIDPQEVELLKAIQELLLNYIISVPYWQRTWTLQELAFASQAYVYFGSQYVSWKIFKQAFMDFMGVHRGDERRLDGFLAHCNAETLIKIQMITDGTDYTSVSHTLGKNHQDMKSFRYHSGLLLPDAFLSAVRSQQASDPRDKLFGIFKVMDYYSSGVLRQPDYSRTTVDIFQEATIAIMQSEKADCGLRMLRLSPSDKRDPALPSWVPDLNGGDSEIWPMPSNVWRIEYGYHSMGTFHGSFRFTSGTTPGLEIESKHIGKVSHVCDREDGPQRDIMGGESEEIRLPLWDPFLLSRWGRVISHCSSLTVPLEEIPDVIRLGLQRRTQHRGTGQEGCNNATRSAWTKDILDPDSEIGQALKVSLPFWNYIEHPINKANLSDYEDLARSLIYCYERLRPERRCKDQVCFSIGTTMFGFAIDDVQLRDSVVLFPGLDAPAIIRPCGDNFSLIGFAYVPGLMEERAWDGFAYVPGFMGSMEERVWKLEGVESQTITLI